MNFTGPWFEKVLLHYPQGGIPDQALNPTFWATLGAAGWLMGQFGAVAAVEGPIVEHLTSYAYIPPDIDKPVGQRVLKFAPGTVIKDSSGNPVTEVKDKNGNTYPFAVVNGFEVNAGMLGSYYDRMPVDQFPGYDYVSNGVRYVSLPLAEQGAWKQILATAVDANPVGNPPLTSVDLAL